MVLFIGDKMKDVYIFTIGHGGRTIEEFFFY